MTFEGWIRAIEEEYRARSPASAALFARAKRVMPGGDTRASVTMRPHPLFFEGGEGPFLWDVDGNEYLDLNNNNTTLIHGHSHPYVLDAVRAQARVGTVWPGPNEKAVNWAETLRHRIPSIEKIRFTASGTEANMQMVRAARAFTGRDTVLRFDRAYHGSWEGLEVDSVGLASRGAPRSVGRNVVAGTFNNTQEATALIRKHGSNLAAVIVTPVWTVDRFTEPAPGFLEGLRDATETTGALLLFDEVISFRVAPGGAQERYSVNPDLTALGKVIGGGLPVGAFGGRAEVMDVTDPFGTDPVWLAGTFNANPLTAAGGIAALELLTSETYDRLERFGIRFRERLRDLIMELRLPYTLEGVASLVSMTWEGNEAPTVNHGMRLACLNNGLIGFPTMSLSTVMEEAHIYRALQAIRAALRRMPVSESLSR